MKHITQKIEKFIHDRLEIITNNNFESSFSNGYKQAIIDIKNIIWDNDSKNLIGKWGYFWDDDMKTTARFAKLHKINLDGQFVSYFNDEFENTFENFSLTIPEHLK
jgi:hypothetical protein